MANEGVVVVDEEGGLEARLAIHMHHQDILRALRDVSEGPQALIDYTQQQAAHEGQHRGQQHGHHHVHHTRQHQDPARPRTTTTIA